MCGIAGYTLPASVPEGVLQNMTRTLTHRGPDREGYFSDSQIALGHRRLIVIEPDGGEQPRVDDASKDAMVFNGEIYGYREQARRLRDEGVHLADGSDTEVLFQTIRRYGIDEALSRIDGMFAFAFRDGQTGALYLARDRFGEKPLFFSQQGDTLVFGSEIKSLLQHPVTGSAAPDPIAVSNFLSLEFLPAPLTMWKGLNKLKPGHVLKWHDGKLEIYPYWKPEYEHAPAMSESEAADRLDVLLQESIKQRLVADVPVGVFLSGGLDSSLVTAIAIQHSPSITAYTMKMTDASYDESAYAAEVAESLGIAHHVREFGDRDVSDAFDSVAGMLDEPLADYSLLPTYLLCRTAVEKETVALGGDGADELFAGYGTFKAHHLTPLMSRLPQSAGRFIRAGVDLLPSREGYMSGSFIAKQLSHGVGYPPEYQTLLWLAPFSDDAKRKIWKQDAVPFPGTGAVPVQISDILESQDRNLSATSKVIDLFQRTYLPDDILTKLDRSSMYVSLETRQPYLSREFAEFAMSLPATWKANRGATKYILKKLASRYLPENVVYRKKQGFGFPMARFLRTVLKERVWDTLLQSPGNPVSDWFDTKEIERYLVEHQSGRRDHRKQIWGLVVLFMVAARSKQLTATAATGEQP